MVMLDAERFKMTVAPARAAVQEGGIGTQRSSQISTKNVNRLSSWDSKISCSPKGIPSCPRTSTVVLCPADAGANWRNS
jgi:hypothetical protein